MEPTINLDLRPRSSRSVVREREDLEELLKTPGWKRFAAHCTEEYKGNGYFTRMGHALKSNDPVAGPALHKTSLAVEELVNWVSWRVNELKGAVDNE